MDRRAVGWSGFTRPRGLKAKTRHGVRDSSKGVARWSRPGHSSGFFSLRRQDMGKQSSQKFIARNRAPRVQIEYDVEIFGAQKKVQVPFVMGVMSDLSGANNAELPGVEERKALEIDVDNFDSRLQAMKPRVSFAVPNTLTGEGNLNVDVTFESMDDFSPAAVARKVGAVAKLLEARTQLANLNTYMDGKAGAEKLIANAIRDPALLQSLTSAPKPSDAADDAASKE
jgi:type VI secretion system protein ImpB